MDELHGCFVGTLEATVKQWETRAALTSYLIANAADNSKAVFEKSPKGVLHLPFPI